MCDPVNCVLFQIVWDNDCDTNGIGIKNKMENMC